MAGIQSYISRAKKDLGYSDIDTGPSSTKKEKKLKNRDGKDFVPTKKKVSMGKITTMKKGGKTTQKKADGGSLKSVPADNKGLGKLSQPVRNKMGYMKNGGVVKMRGGGAATQGMNFNRGY